MPEKSSGAGAATTNLFLTPASEHNVPREASQSEEILRVGSASVAVTGKPVLKLAVIVVLESTEHESAMIPRTSTSQILPVPYSFRLVPVKVSVVCVAVSSVTEV